MPKFSAQFSWMTFVAVGIVLIIVVTGAIHVFLNNHDYTYAQYLDDVKGLWKIVGPVAGARALPAAAKRLNGKS